MLIELQYPISVRHIRPGGRDPETTLAAESMTVEVADAPSAAAPVVLRYQLGFAECDGDWTDIRHHDGTFWEPQWDSGWIHDPDTGHLRCDTPFRPLAEVLADPTTGEVLSAGEDREDARTRTRHRAESWLIVDGHVYQRAQELTWLVSQDRKTGEASIGLCPYHPAHGDSERHFRLDQLDRALMRVQRMTGKSIAVHDKVEIIDATALRHDPQARRLAKAAAATTAAARALSDPLRAADPLPGEDDPVTFLADAIAAGLAGMTDDLGLSAHERVRFLTRLRDRFGATH